MVEGRGDGLLSGGDVHFVWLRDLANTVVSRWYPAYVESDQTSLITTEVNRQQSRLPALGDCLLAGA